MKNQKTAPSLNASDESFFDRLYNRAITVRVLAVLCVVFAIAAAVGPMVTVYLLHEPERVAIVQGDGSVTISLLQRYKTAFSFHKIAANESSRAMLNRNPAGLDDTDLIQITFNDKARAKLDEFTKSQEQIFRDYSYHQKVEIETTEIAADPDGTFRARVRGQLIRTGVFNNAAKLDRLKFQLILYMFRNPDAATNQKYPLGVWNFDYSESR